MKLNARWGWFLGFTAIFAVLAAWVFWGTWSTDFAPVMPDCPTTHSPYWFTGAWRGILTSGKFVPDDLKGFVAPPYVWQELQYALALFFAALGMAYYCRGRGLSRLASYGAGILLAFCGYWCSLFSAGHLGWFRWMTYGVFAFGLADRAVRKGKLKNWLLLGACVAWGSFYQSDLWLLFTVFTGFYFVWCCVRERKLPWKGAFLAVAVFLAVGAPAIRSAFVNDLAGRDKQIEDGQTVAGSDGMDEREKRWIFVTNWSLPPEESAEFFVPRLNGDTSCPMTLSLGARYGTGVRPYTGALGRPKDAPAGNYRQHSLYVGFVTCLLALLGIASAFFRLKVTPPKNRKTSCSDLVFFLVAAIVFWLCSMGRYCEPVYRVVFSLPFGDYLRAPVKWHHLTEFCLVVLAGFGIEALLSLLSRVSLLKAYALPVVGAVVVIGAIDLARVDHLYCAPVDLREAKRQNCSLQMTFLHRQDFNNPQIAAMVSQKKIVALAQPNPETYLVGVLNPWGKPDGEPMPPMGTGAWLSVLSVVSALAMGGLTLTMRNKAKFVRLCAVLALLGASGCRTVQKDSDLVFHCTFDDDAAILSPEVGSAGAINGATYRDGKIGKALYVPAKSAVATFPFPEGLPTEQGTIEFWGKIENDRPFYRDGCDPYLFIVTKDGAKGWPVVFELNFNANNGCGASGLFCGMSYGRAVNIHGRGNCYAEILGAENSKDWHLYRVVWNLRGLNQDGDIMQVWIDNRHVGSGMRGEKMAADFRSGIGGAVHLVFSNPQSGHGLSPVCVDEFKMWSVAKGAEEK